MKIISLITVLMVALVTTGCANNAAKDYYLAMQQAAQADAAKSEARYRALATVASTGDQNTAIAATMAIAMSQDRVIVPQYIESEALKWAQVLAAPVAAVGGMWIQADVTKNASNNARDVQLGQLTSQQAIQLGQQQTQAQMVLGLTQANATAGQAYTQTITDLGLAGFNALNRAGDQTLQAATIGFDATVNVATQGFQTLDSLNINNAALVDGIVRELNGTTQTFILNPIVTPAPNLGF